MPTHPAFPLVCWLALALTLPRLTPLALLLVSLVGAVYLGRAVWAASRREDRPRSCERGVSAPVLASFFREIA